MPGIYTSSSAGTSLTASSVTWNVWTDDYATNYSTGSSTSATQTIWTNWHVHYSANGNTEVTLVSRAWDSWNNEYGTITTRLSDSARAQQVIQHQQQRTQPTKEQHAQWKREEDERRRREQAEAKKRLEARTRARELLVGCLSKQQREDLEKKKCFFLESHSADGSKRKYRIDEGTHGNIKLLDDKDRVVGSYCVQPNGVPIEDSMLAQKLWIETNEEAFKKVANFTRH